VSDDTLVLAQGGILAPVLDDILALAHDNPVLVDDKALVLELRIPVLACEEHVPHDVARDEDEDVVHDVLDASCVHNVSCNVYA